MREDFPERDVLISHFWESGSSLFPR